MSVDNLGSCTMPGLALKDDDPSGAGLPGRRA